MGINTIPFSRMFYTFSYKILNDNKRINIMDYLKVLTTYTYVLCEATSEKLRCNQKGTHSLSRAQD